ncbi:alkaline phosphatase family protein [Haladaptatus sp. DYF46]|uniref:alkaline phosphatase family protein n=1 Tax=Haladaptatus sp. DYF46 TaxID=2886041 RepID=UPI001E3E89E4|nr:alkaline phosphatase family protein [Haladaptatus sp. DYF46]
MELLIIGSDGASPRLLNYYLQKGRMPSLQSFLETPETEMKPMASRFAGNDVPHTGPAWTSIYTGLRAEQHGVTEEGWVEGRISLSPHFENTVFSRLMDDGLTVGSFTMPITYPAQVGNDSSWMLSGYPSSELTDRLLSPAEKQPALPDDYSNLQAKHLLAEDGPKPPEKWVESERRKVNDVLPCLATGDEDVLFYGTQITDVMGHRARYRPFLLNGALNLACEKTNDLLGTVIQPPRVGSIVWTKEMRTAYETLDWVFGKLIEKYQPEDVLLVSDHGFQLIGADHAFLGVSAATSGIERPESILEVKRVILDRFGIDEHQESTTIDRPQDELDEEDEDVMGQLEALGYR